MQALGSDLSVRIPKLPSPQECQRPVFSSPQFSLAGLWEASLEERSLLRRQALLRKGSCLNLWRSQCASILFPDNRLEPTVPDFSDVTLVTHITCVSRRNRTCPCSCKSWKMDRVEITIGGVSTASVSTLPHDFPATFWSPLEQSDLSAVLIVEADDDRWTTGFNRLESCNDIPCLE
jgi:hypothetical protein